MQEMDIKAKTCEWYVWENVCMCVYVRGLKKSKAEQPSGRPNTSNDGELNFCLMPFHQHFCTLPRSRCPAGGN